MHLNMDCNMSNEVIILLFEYKFCACASSLVFLQCNVKKCGCQVTLIFQCIVIEFL